jgi:hypothetical protein
LGSLTALTIEKATVTAIPKSSLVAQPETVE